MQIKDHSGLSYSGAGHAALDHYQAALEAWHCYAGDPIAALDQALAERPDFVMAYLAKAWVLSMGTDPTTAQMAGVALEAASGLPMNDREAAHARALGLYFSGELRAAARVMEDLSVAWPLDSLALQAGQLLDFLLGESRMLRDRIARALPDWSASMPHWHGVQSFLAFGLEETGAYDRARQAGLESLSHNRRNTWAHHAVAHCFQMEGRPAEGAAWMRSLMDDWSTDSSLSIHNHWHLGLFHLSLGEVDEVLRLYDGPIYGERSDMPFDQVDASAMLWRLHLSGIDVADRWEKIADSWEGVMHVSTYAFSDAHAMMAFVGSGRRPNQQILLEAQRLALEAPGDNARFIGEVGGPVTRAIEAFGRGAYGEAVELLRPVRNRAARFGGSHAQRDIIDLTLIEAARRDGQRTLARALEAERALLGVASQPALDRAA